jgi:peptide/nickel transport system substrate-binding protein
MFNRRQIVLRGLSLGLAAPAIASLLAACGGSSSTPTQSSSSGTAGTTDGTGTSSSSASSATPAASISATPSASSSTGSAPVQRSGGSLVVSSSESPSSLDPAFGINGPEYTVTSWIFDNLVWLSSKLELQPLVATKWDSTPDAKTWTFTLRDDVKFTNGRQLVADDVVFSIMRILNPDTGSPGRSGVGPVDTVEATDDQTVVFHMKSSYADFPLEMTQRWGRIVPKEAVADLKTKPIGSGPFKLKEYVPGSYVKVEHNSDHWDPNAGLVDEIELRTIPDTIAEVTALQNNETQLMLAVAVDSVDQLKKSDGVVVDEIPTGNWYPMIMRVDTHPFDKKEVREAIKYCMDRPQFVDAVLQGHGTVGNDNNVPPNHPFAWKSDARARNIDKAKELLSQAGLANGFEFDVVAATDNPIRANAAVTIQQMTKDAGIKFNVKTIDYDTYIAQVYKKGPCYIGSWAMRPTLDSQLTPFFSTGGSFNEYAYSNPDLDKILDQARAELDADKRKDLYIQAQQILTNSGPAIIAFFGDVITAYRDTVVGFKSHPLSYTDLRYVSLKK